MFSFVFYPSGNKFNVGEKRKKTVQKKNPASTADGEKNRSFKKSGSPWVHLTEGMRAMQTL
jgi:hypothetical protein